jgi:hypothetical protein
MAELLGTQISLVLIMSVLAFPNAQPEGSTAIGGKLALERPPDDPARRDGGLERP